MSKAFTKEDDGPENIRLDDLPQSPHPNYVTPAGLAALNDRLRARTHDLEVLRAANDDMKSQLSIAVAERDIRFLAVRISQAILIDPKDHKPGIVAFGAEVEVIDETDHRHTFRIVGEDEANPALGLITPFSPLAIALNGYRRIHVLLRREGWPVNAKRIYRLYNEMALQLRNKTPKRRVKAKLREDRVDAKQSNETWAITARQANACIR